VVVAVVAAVKPEAMVAAVVAGAAGLLDQSQSCSLLARLSQRQSAAAVALALDKAQVFLRQLAQQVTIRLYLEASALLLLKVELAVAQRLVHRADRAEPTRGRMVYHRHQVELVGLRNTMAHMAHNLFMPLVAQMAAQESAAVRLESAAQAAVVALELASVLPVEMAVGLVTIQRELALLQPQTLEVVAEAAEAQAAVKLRHTAAQVGRVWFTFTTLKTSEVICDSEHALL
jgi:hypothetical protein